MPREKSAGAIIFRMENSVPHYLLLHYPAMNRKGGHWEFTKGHIEQGESEEETVRREVQEETGIAGLKILPGFKEYIKYFFKQQRKNKKIPALKREKVVWIFKLVVFFVAETNIKEIKLSPEHINFAWLPFNEAFEKVTYKNSKELLKRANKFIISEKNI